MLYLNNFWDLQFPTVGISVSIWGDVHSKSLDFSPSRHQVVLSSMKKRPKEIRRRIPIFILEATKLCEKKRSSRHG